MRLLFFSVSRAFQRFHFPRFLNVFPRQPPASYFPAHRCPFFPRSAIFLVSLVCAKISNHSNNLFHLSFVCWFLQPILEAGAVNLLSNLTRRQETALRLNGVWALMVSVAKNLCLRADGILELQDKTETGDLWMGRETLFSFFNRIWHIKQMT